MDDTLTSLLANMVSMVERLNQLDDFRGEQIKALHAELAELREQVLSLDGAYRAHLAIGR